jgi:transcriptional regulator with XRE-family HTH domain
MRENFMFVTERLREIRIQKKLSQGDIEDRTGLLRCYVSRVEHRHTVPSVETLEKFARALGVPLYELFYDGDEPPPPRKIAATHQSPNARGKHQRTLQKVQRFLGQMQEKERALLLSIANKMIQNRSMKKC